MPRRSTPRCRCACTRSNRRDAIRIVYQRGFGDYYGIQQTSWTDAPILQGASVERRIGGRTYRLFYDGSKLQMVAFEENGAVYWVVEHAAPGALERDDDRHRQGLEAARGGQVSDLAPIGVLGAGWVGLVTAACFADLGHDVIVRDVVPERIEDLEAGRVPIFEPGLGELVAKNRDRLRFTLDAGAVFEAARIVFVCVGTPPTYSGDADLQRRLARARRDPGARGARRSSS